MANAGVLASASTSVTHFPAMTYRGRGLRRTADNAWVMNGSLTIRGVTKEVPLTFRYKGLFPDMPAGQPARASFHATAAVKRGNFGITRDNLMELGPNRRGRMWRSKLRNIFPSNKFALAHGLPSR